MPPDQLLDLVERLVMGFGLTVQEFPDRQGVPIQKNGNFPNGKVFSPHIRPEPFSQFAHYVFTRIIISR
jgi:hypothetical protein